MRCREGWLALLAILLLFPDCQCFKKQMPESLLRENIGLGEGQDTFALLFSTSMHGYVEPCGCTSQPLGGISRLATIVLKARDNYTLGTLLMDGGDLLFDSAGPINPADQCQQTARVDLLLDTFKELSLEGTFVGPFDDAMGRKFREQKFQRYRISDLTGKAREGYLSGSKQFSAGVLLLDDGNFAGLNNKAKALKSKGAQAVIVLSRLSRARSRAVAEVSPMVDVIILAGVNEEMPSAAEAIGPFGPVMVSAGKQGQYLGLVEFHRISEKPNAKWMIDNRRQEDEKRTSLLVQRKKTVAKQIEQTKDQDRLNFLKIRLTDLESELANLEARKTRTPMPGNSIETRFIPLSRMIPANPHFDERLKNYEKQIPVLVSQCEEKVECPSITAGQAVFVGAENCKTCHEAAYNVWKKGLFEVPATDENGKATVAISGHSEAWATLEAMKKTQDRSCVGCHSIGFMQPGGYCKVNEVEFRANVQCESCHGAGSLHAASGDKRQIQREVPESVCRKCHHVPHIPTTESFIWSEKVKKILGKGHGDLLLEKLKHAS